MTQALLFPGQGVQQPAMGEPWLGGESWRVVARISEWTGFDVEELLLTADADTLRRTDHAQIAVFTTSVMALHDALRDGVAIDACAGHSLGEITALVAAGAVALEDGARLVAARGRAMRDAIGRAPGTMAVVLGAELEAVEAVAAEARDAGADVWVANVNAPGQVVVSGTEAGVERACALASDDGLRIVRIPVQGPFHTPLMAAARPALRRALDEVTFAAEHVPVVANVDARAYAADTDWSDLETRQLTCPVRWADGVRTLVGELGCDRLLELGTGRTLTAMAKRITRDAEAVAGAAPA